MSIRLKLILFISFLFITAIGNSLLTFKLEKYADEKLEWVNHTNAVIVEVKDFLSHMKDTETGQRGYLLTTNTSYLEPYYKGLSSAKSSFNKLKEFTSDNSLQQKRLVSIKKMMKLKFEELAHTIKLKENQNSKEDKALAVVKQNKGKQYMDEIRTLLSDFTYTEMILLEQRKGDFRAQRAQITTVIFLEVMFFVFLAIMTISFLNKNLFAPLKLLLNSTHKMDNGEKINITDIASNDEMGYLLTSFFKMNEKVVSRTEKLDYKAHHDELTGLKNRTKMYFEMEEAVEDLKEFNKKFAVLFMDLDKFKQLNDTLGHDAGDIMLKELASRLKLSVRADDTVFRIGGDEFLVLIKNATENKIVEQVISNILDSMKAPVMIQGQAIDILLSIGIAIAPDDSKNSDQIIKYSDIAMYEAKQDKGSSYKFFDKSMLKRATD